MKNNGEIVSFFKKKDYIMVDNDLGSGSFGKTVIIKDPFIDELFVAKKYEPYFEEDRKQFFTSFLSEIKIMYKLYHKNVVRIFNYFPYEDNETGYIIMEHIDGKPIDEYMHNDFCTTFGATPDSLFSQLIDGFEYIESKGIIHRDIREGNILVTTKDDIVKIIDFGLGKTFSPVEKSNDSMVEIINRSGLDCLPEEYFEGKYDSKTDMFYLAELFGRLLRESDNEHYFSYPGILKKMMSFNRNDRYDSFSKVKEAINAKDFSVMEIKPTDKKIYQNFTNAIYNCLGTFKNKREFVSSVSEFLENLKNIIKENCFEDYVQDNSKFVGILVNGNYTYYPNTSVKCDILTSFEKWFSKLSTDSQKLVFNNMIAKISTKAIQYADDELPF